MIRAAGIREWRTPDTPVCLEPTGFPCRAGQGGLREPGVAESHPETS